VRIFGLYEYANKIIRKSARIFLSLVHRVDQFRRTLNHPPRLLIQIVLSSPSIRAISQKIVSRRDYPRAFSLANSFLSPGPNANTRCDDAAFEANENYISENYISARVACDYKANKRTELPGALSFGEQRGGLVAYSRAGFCKNAPLGGPPFV